MKLLFVRVVAFVRDLPLTAPFVAALDTLIATIRGNVAYAVSEPLVVLGAIEAIANEVVVDAGWKGWVVAYVTAAARWFTTPRIDTRSV